MASYNDFVCVDDFEKYALSTLSKSVGDFYRSGAIHEQTLHENREAFRRLRFRARCMVDVSKRSLSTDVLGKRISFPIGIAPTAAQRMAHPDGEIATAKAAAAEDTVMILSTLSTTSLEDVAEASPGSYRWLQIYLYKDRNSTRDIVQRAEKAGYSAIVLTVDSPVYAQRFTEDRNGFSIPPRLKLANLNIEDIKSAATSNCGSNSNASVHSTFDASLTWKDIFWLKSVTALPILVKGIVTAEDAILAVEHGVAGIIVSNHGGRQLDGVPATIEALPEIVKAVGKRCEVYLDGGIRNGTDALKALALGAKAVFVGRPILWGLAHNGQNGARKILQILRKELDISLALLGCPTIHDIKPSMVVRQEFYSKI